jgi:hypothetical protein
MNQQINNVPCPYWQSFPNEVYVSIFKHFSRVELKTISAVSQQWNDIANSEIIFKSFLNGTFRSVKDLLQNPDTPQIFYLAANSQFSCPDKNSLKLNYDHFKSNVRPFDQAKGLENLMVELMTNYELGTPKLHFWKPLPPHTFTIALGIYITKHGQSYPKKDVNEVSISFIDPFETDSFSIKERSESFPCYASHACSDREHAYSAFAYFWHGNLNDQTALSIQFNFTDGFSSVMRKISKIFLNLKTDKNA